MKKHLLFYLLICLTLSQYCIAQKTSSILADKKQSLSASAGYVFPSKSNNYGDEYISSDFDFSLTYTRIPKKVLGYMLQARVIAIKRDKNAMEDVGYFGIREYSTYKSGLYTRYGLLLGPVVSIPVNTFSIDLKGYVGPCYSVYPKLKITSTLASYVFWQTNSGKAIGFMYGAGLGFSKSINQKYKVGLSADYTKVTAKFKNITTTIGNESGERYVIQQDIKLPLRSLSLSLNLGLIF